MCAKWVNRGLLLIPYPLPSPILPPLYIPPPILPFLLIPLPPYQSKYSIRPTTCGFGLTDDVGIVKISRLKGQADEKFNIDG